MEVRTIDYQKLRPSRPMPAGAGALDAGGWLGALGYSPSTAVGSSGEESSCVKLDARWRVKASSAQGGYDTREG
jgi:hypothetical protein